MTKWLTIAQAISPAHDNYDSCAITAKSAKTHHCIESVQATGQQSNTSGCFDSFGMGINYSDRFNERAAIIEFDGGLSRTAAEQQAHNECITRWGSK